MKEVAESSVPRSERLLFHMAVMKWKVSTLTPDELNVLQSWIDDQYKTKEQARLLPWAQEANEYGDTLFAENTHIQRYVTSYKLPVRNKDSQVC